MDYEAAKVLGCVPVTASSSWVLRSDGEAIDLRLFTKNAVTGYTGHTGRGITVPAEVWAALSAGDGSEVELVIGDGEAVPEAKPVVKVVQSKAAPAARKAARSRSASAKKGAATRARNTATRQVSKSAEAQMRQLKANLRSLGIKVA